MGAESDSTDIENSEDHESFNNEQEEDSEEFNRLSQTSSTNSERSYSTNCNSHGKAIVDFAAGLQDALPMNQVHFAIGVKKTIPHSNKSYKARRHFKTHKNGFSSWISRR